MGTEIGTLMSYKIYLQRKIERTKNLMVKSKH